MSTAQRTKATRSGSAAKIAALARCLTVRDDQLAALRRGDQPGGVKRFHTFMKAHRAERPKPGEGLLAIIVVPHLRRVRQQDRRGHEGIPERSDIVGDDLAWFRMARL